MGHKELNDLSKAILIGMVGETLVAYCGDNGDNGPAGSTGVPVERGAEGAQGPEGKDQRVRMVRKALQAKTAEMPPLQTKGSRVWRWHQSALNSTVCF